jgi:hypothetical protein
MKTDIKIQKIVPIDWVEESDRWILAPGTVLEKERRRIKQIVHVKNKCHFAAGVPGSIYDFIYRAVKNLNMTDRTLIFSRGMVRNSRTRLKLTVSIRELDWAVGTLITIPRLLPYREMITLEIEKKEYTLRLMELVVLRGLLALAVPGREWKYYPAMAALILARGWKELGAEKMPAIYRKDKAGK